MMSLPELQAMYTSAHASCPLCGGRFKYKGILRWEPTHNHFFIFTCGRCALTNLHSITGAVTEG